VPSIFPNILSIQPTLLTYIQFQFTNINPKINA
jgi:hypothetical protein